MADTPRGVETEFPLCAVCGNRERPEHVHLGLNSAETLAAARAMNAKQWGASVEVPSESASTHTPPPLTRGGRRSKRKGYEAEKKAERLMAPFGFSRMPLSGALGGRWGGDLRGDPSKALHVVEVKLRRGMQTMMRKWLAQGNAHLLVVDTGQGAEPLAVLNLSTLLLVLDEAAYGRQTCPNLGHTAP